MPHSKPSRTSLTSSLNRLRVFRDPSAWYHLTLAVDTTQATAESALIVCAMGFLVFKVAIPNLITNPIEIIINDNDEPSPYITIRKNLKALISRPVYYDLINMAEEEIIDDKKFLVIKSNNTLFKLYEINNSA